MRHIGEKLALGLTSGQGRAHGIFQVFGALPDALFQKIAMLLDLSRLLRCSSSIMRLKLRPRFFDFVARLADLHRLEAPLANRRDSLLQQRQRTGQNFNRELRNQSGYHGEHDDHQHHAFAQAEGVVKDIPQQHDP